jgi:hypothetical protein
LGSKIIREIERKERAALGELSESRATDYKQQLYKIVQRLSGLDSGALQQGREILAEWRRNPTLGIGTSSIARTLPISGLVFFGLYLATLVIIPMLMLALWWRDDLLSGRDLIFIASATGSLGANIAALSSFVASFRTRLWTAAQLLWYLKLPLSGAGLGVIVATAWLGITAPSVRTSYQLAAVCGIVGLFADQALRKIHEVAQTLFRLRAEPPYGSR